MSEKPNNIIPFKFYSEEEEKTYEGTFTVRRISVFGANEIQMLGNQLTSGLGVVNTVHAEMIRFMAVIGHMVTDVKNCDWYNPENLTKTWSNIHDIDVLHELHKEVIAYDQWFRKGSKDRRNQEKSKKDSTRKSKKTTESTNSVGREKSGDEQKESGVSEVVVG